MQVNIAGRHVEITEAIRQAVDHKLSKIQSHYPQIDACDVVVTVEKNEQSVELTTHFMGEDFAAEGKHDDMYAALASAVKKLDTELARKKGMQKAQRHQGGGLADSIAQQIE